MDGTLFQTDKVLELSLEETFNYLRSLNKWNTETPLAKYRDIMGVPLPKVWKTLLPNHTEMERTTVDAYFLERLIVNIKKGKGALYPNVIETFQFLKQNGYSIFIASNGLIKYLEEIVQCYKLERWVDETFSIEHIDSLNKSDLVRTIVNKYKLSSGVVVGDRISDINAAKDNNLLSIGCRFDFAKEEELSQADIVINHLSELEAVLANNHGKQFK
jgi:phosphoglycolate phosphatase-like HAD superfamily hydrolase